MDVAIAGGSAGYAVYFDAKPVSPATAVWNNAHYAGYVPRAAGSTFSITDALGCWGGANAEDLPCP